MEAGRERETHRGRHERGGEGMGGVEGGGEAALPHWQWGQMDSGGPVFPTFMYCFRSPSTLQFSVSLSTCGGWGEGQHLSLIHI